MLGSIGADGMPNAHYDFPIPKSNVPKPSLPSVQASENTAPPTTLREPGKPNEATKAAPFKLRHTVYDPNVTLVKNQESTQPVPTPRAKQEGASSADERSPSPISEPEVERSSLSSGDQPPSYDSMPLTHVTMPEIVASKPVVKERAAYNDDRPPTPPPKDAKPHIKTNGRSRKVNRDTAKPTTNVPVSKFNAPAPAIGDLSFEKNDESEKRPQLESFVTATESSELK